MTTPMHPVPKRPPHRPSRKSTGIAFLAGVVATGLVAGLLWITLRPDTDVTPSNADIGTTAIAAPSGSVAPPATDQSVPQGFPSPVSTATEEPADGTAESSAGPSSRSATQTTESSEDKDKDKDDKDKDDENEDGKPQNIVGREQHARPATAGLPAIAKVDCPAGGTTVTTADELTDALESAQPGGVIRLADGTYEGKFVASTSGTADKPIWLCGGREAVIDGGGVKSGYAVHLDGAQFWRVVGFTIKNSQKGLMADSTTGSVIQGLAISEIGDEALHLRGNSTKNLVIGNEISSTGKRRDKFGEGIYIGTAISNWCTITACQPDRSDDNVVAQNVISGTTSENVDIKEGTVGGLLIGNTFDGAATVAADSWVDVKGTGWTIADNKGVNAPYDGFQTHQIEERWGERNLFTGNDIAAGEVNQDVETNSDDPRYGIALRPVGDNLVSCSNKVSAGGIELANIPCTD